MNGLRIEPRVSVHYATADAVKVSRHVCVREDGTSIYWVDLTADGTDIATLFVETATDLDELFAKLGGRCE